MRTDPRKGLKREKRHKETTHLKGQRRTIVDEQIESFRHIYIGVESYFVVKQHNFTGV